MQRSFRKLTVGENVDELRLEVILNVSDWDAFYVKKKVEEKYIITFAKQVNFSHLLTGTRTEQSQ